MLWSFLKERGMQRTKFLAPRPANVLERERLISKLASWDDRKVLIIHAQAGQGKSTLAAAYGASRTEPMVWYTMDTGDGDPAVFLSSLGEALHAALPERFPKALPLARGEFSPTGLERAVLRWTSRVFGGSVLPILLVFDDHHLAASQPLRHVLKLLVETTPASVRFLILSRTRPDLGIAGLRAKRGVAELTGKDLRFTDDEVRQLFGEVLGMPVDAGEASEINRTVEGWPAGLVLLHGYFASLPGHGRIAALGEHARPELRTHIFEYLAQEVFSSLPAGVQDFLLRTSVADALTPPLLALLSGLPERAAAGRPSVETMVLELKHRNLFITGGESAEPVIRYHALFREFLLNMLRVRRPGPAVRRLYAAAAGYFRTAGDPVRVVNLWLEAGETGRAVREMETCCQELIAQGRIGTLVRWVDALPADRVRRPWFHFIRATACRYTEPPAALALYDRAQRGFQASRNNAGRMLALSGIIESCFHTGGDFRRMGRTAAQANKLLKRCGRGAPRERARLLLAAGMAWFFTGRLRQSTAALQQALALFRRQNDRFSQVTCAIYLTPCALYQGDFRLAREAVSAGLEASDGIPEETGGRTALLLTRAMTALFEGNFAEAEENIGQCRKLADDHAYESIGFLSLDIGGWLKIAQGDYAGAARLLEECKQRGEAARHPFFSASAAHLLAITHLFRGRLMKAKAESDHALMLQKRTDSPLFHGIYLIASGAIHLKLGKTAESERELCAALELLGRCHAVQQEANAHLLLASLNLRRRREQAARRHLAAGFGIGEERGFTYYALLKSDELAKLAAAAIDRGIEPEYCRRLAAGTDAGPANPSVRIYCLGEFKVVRNGVPVRDGEWKSRLAKTLVKLLAIRGSRKLTRDEAAEALWPAADASQAPHMLNSLLHRTRKALEPGHASARGDSCILQEGNLLSLNPRKVWTDIGEFSALHAAARQKRMNRDRDSGRTLALYDQAFSLYRGDFLPGDLYHDWARSTHDHLKDLHIEMLKHAVELKSSAADRDTASAYYEKMFALDPCDEKACRWLMADRMALGQRSEAIRLFDRCQLALKKELDIEPDEQTRRLYRSIIGG
jgi:ATP/maltotriose-dependent transcriptional regulator MalT/DNA-binding SARP family transcriptional activator